MAANRANDENSILETATAGGIKDDMRRKDLTGQRLGKWLVLGFSEYSQGRTYWSVICDCGNKFIREGASLRGGRSKSCGCDRAARRAEMNRAGRPPKAERDNMRRSPTYKSWLSMRARCNNPGSGNWAEYGGKGIKMCDRWLSYENFLTDMGERPPGHSIDRIDNDGDYTPENCRWATQRQQNRNQRRNRLITHQGATKCLAEWAEESGVAQQLLRSRLERGWTFERAMRPAG